MTKITQDRFFLTTGHNGEVELRYRDEANVAWHVLQINQDGTLERNGYLAPDEPFKTDESAKRRIVIKENPFGDTF